VARTAVLLTSGLPEQRYLVPQWPAPDNVLAVATKRDLGQPDLPPMAGFNLARHVTDDEQRVHAHRCQLSLDLQLQQEPVWLHQVHGTGVVQLPLATRALAAADASTSAMPGQVCVVMTADCLPVLFCDSHGTRVAAAHAGWRGLLAGVLENTLSYFADPADVMVWLGPAIGPLAFEVGDDVRQGFVSADAQASHYFVPCVHKPHKYLADIYGLARLRLRACGVEQIYGGQECTLSQSQDYFSHRRDPASGRQASLITLL
jgi:hypothetical protein